jgi:hypothetical protein
LSTSELLAAIDKIAEKLGTTATQIIDQYAVWHVTSSIVWVALSVVAIVFAVRWKPEDDVMRFVRVAAIVLSTIIGSIQISDLVAPRAKAIHQLLIDIR